MEAEAILLRFSFLGRGRREKIRDFAALIAALLPSTKVAQAESKSAFRLARGIAPKSILLF